MAWTLKTPNKDAAQDAANETLRRSVSRIILDVEARGDAAVRDYSKRFDGLERETYRLSRSEIDDALGRLGRQERSDIEFASRQIRSFGGTTKGVPSRPGGRDSPRGDSGTPSYSGIQRRLLCARRKVSDGGLRSHVGADCQGGGLPKGRDLRTAL